MPLDYSKSKIALLKGKISTLEWDLQFMKDGHTKSSKEKQLDECRKELEEAKKEVV